MGSHWRGARGGVMWSLLPIPIRTLAVAFWIRWRHPNELFRHPDNNELQFYIPERGQIPYRQTKRLKKQYQVIYTQRVQDPTQWLHFCLTWEEGHLQSSKTLYLWAWSFAHCSVSSSCHHNSSKGKRVHGERDQPMDRTLRSNKISRRTRPVDEAVRRFFK